MGAIATCIRQIVALRGGARAIVNVRQDMLRGWVRTSIIKGVLRKLIAAHPDLSSLTLVAVHSCVDAGPATSLFQGPAVRRTPALVRVSTVAVLSERHLAMPKRLSPDDDPAVVVADLNADLAAGETGDVLRGKRPFCWAAPEEDLMPAGVSGVAGDADLANASFALGIPPGTHIVLIRYGVPSGTGLYKPTGLEGAGNQYYMSLEAGEWGQTANPNLGGPVMREAVHQPVKFQSSVTRVQYLGATSQELPDLEVATFKTRFPNQPWARPAWETVAASLNWSL